MSINLRIGIIGLVIVTLGILNFKTELAWLLGYEDYLYGPGTFFLQVRPFGVKIPFVHYPIDILFSVALMIASLLYMIKNKGLVVIAFLFALIFAQRVGMIVLFISRFAVSAPSERESLFNLIAPVLLAAASYYVLHVYRQEWETKTFTTKTEATRLQRFFSYAIDVAVIGFMVLPKLDMVTLPFYQRLLIMVLSYTFFVSFERFFLFTPGKIVMKTRVVAENGDTPTEASIFLRNLYRFIPFEALSFFGKKGWHDGLSKTSVFRYD